MMSPMYDAVALTFWLGVNRIDVLSILSFNVQYHSWNSTTIWWKNSDHKMEATRGCIHKPREAEQKYFSLPVIKRFDR